MLAVSFETTFTAMLQIFLLGLAGFVLAKTKFLDVKGLESLSSLIVNIILPAFNFTQVIAHFDPHRFSNWWVFPLLGFAVTLGGLLLASGVLAFNRTLKVRQEFKALIAFQNSGYIPLSILASFPPTETIGQLTIYILIFLVGFDMLVWSLGEWQRLFNPPMLATLASVALIFLGVEEKLPAVVMHPLQMLGNCLLPLVMLVLGGNFAVIDFRKIPFMDVLGVGLVKLIVYPLVMIGVLLTVRVEFLIGFLLVMEASMPCANSLSVIGRYYRTPNQDFINQGLFFTNVVSVLTIPLFLTLYVRLFM
jgi:malate permease and related proteins